MTGLITLLVYIIIIVRHAFEQYDKIIMVAVDMYILIYSYNNIEYSSCIIIITIATCTKVSSCQYKSLHIITFSPAMQAMRKELK